ncbi:MAG TPA: hypothetical protein VFJ78_03995, partial [Gaiellaceae bacterium]|nr:hypothetical protein [Gaiellaceae bacterium]
EEMSAQAEALQQLMSFFRISGAGSPVGGSQVGHRSGAASIGGNVGGYHPHAGMVYSPARNTGAARPTAAHVQGSGRPVEHGEQQQHPHVPAHPVNDRDFTRY